MRIAWTLVFSIALAALAGCASAPADRAPPQLFDDSLFGAPTQPVRRDEIFALSEPMRRFIEEDMAATLRSSGPQRGLIDALYREGALKLEYEATRTRNAAEAFEARAGNCLSLVVMTAAMARHLGIPVRFQSVFVESTWSRSGGMNVASGHVNLVLDRRQPDFGLASQNDQARTVDFLPRDETLGHRTRPIDEATIVAMFMNNRAAESLAQGELDDAYAWVHGALEAAPGFLAAYNTLAVVYERRGSPRHAVLALEHILGREPENTIAMANLARILGRNGELERAAELTRALARIEPYPPFHFFDRGMAALRAGDFAQARELFQRETRRAPYHHEFHYWLAVANLGLDDPAQARKHLLLARQTSTTSTARALYSAKLEKLDAVRRQ
jgi:Tfp pilus assembly protein PilF